MPRKKGPNEKAMSIADQEVLDHYGQLIRKYRKMSDISRVKLCELVDISNSQLSKWECGGAEPRLHSMIRICEVLNIPLEELLFNVKTRRISVDEAKTIKLLRDTPDNIRKSVYELLNTVNRSVRSASSSKEGFTTASDPYDSKVRGDFMAFPSITAENNLEFREISASDDTQEEFYSKSSNKKRPSCKEETESVQSLNSSVHMTAEDAIQHGSDSKSGSAGLSDEENKTIRKRGRPKKIPDPIIEAAKDTTEKRKRGRPRKIVEETVQEANAQTKRKRGRPRRSEVEGMLTSIND